MRTKKQIKIFIPAIALLLQTAVQFSHIFSGHGHELCNNYAEEHFHGDTLECELGSFHSQPALDLSFLNFEPVVFSAPQAQTTYFYILLSEAPPLAYVLRGPPVA